MQRNVIISRKRYRECVGESRYLQRAQHTNRFVIKNDDMLGFASLQDEKYKTGNVSLKQLYSPY